MGLQGHHAWSIALGLALLPGCNPDASGVGQGGTEPEPPSSTDTGLDTSGSSGPPPSTSTTSDASSTTTADPTTTAVDSTTGPDSTTTDASDTEEPPQEVEYCTVANLPIPDNDITGVTSSIDVDLAGGGTIVSLAVVIRATHTFVNDLRFDLRKSSDPVIVIDRPAGCTGDDIDVVLHDDATDPVETGCVDGVVPTLSGELQPHTPLGPVYTGHEMIGTWRLLAIDRAPDDTGTLDAWCLRITYR